jgi:hypothetical protein
VRALAFLCCGAFHAEADGLDSDRESLTAEENRPDIKQREKVLRTNLVKKVTTRLKAMAKYKVS